jgi:hypothetical protein
MARIKIFYPPDPGFWPTAGLLHWDYDWGDHVEHVHLIGYSDYDEIPLGGYDVSLEQPTMALAKSTAQLWAAMPLTAAICCGWCNGYSPRPRIWKPNAYRGENRPPALAGSESTPGQWPTAYYVGHIDVWPNWP